MRSTAEIMSALIATGLTPEQIALMAELSAASATLATSPETPEDRRRRISRETTARHRASQNVTDASQNVTDASHHVTDPAPEAVSPNVTKRHKTSQNVTCDTAHIDSSLSLKLVDREKEPKQETREGRASRIPPDWSLNERDRLYAASRDFSDHQIAGMAEHFLNYWLAKAGKDAAKTNWELTWRNWVISPLAPKPEGRGTGGYAINPDAFV